MTVTNEHEAQAARVVELISRYFAAIDDKRLDQAIAEATFGSGFGQMLATGQPGQRS